MNTHPYVRDLLLFEGQRIGTTIHLDGDARAPARAIPITTPSAEAASTSHDLQLPDGTRHAITLALLPDGEFWTVPGPFGSLAVATATGSTVHLAFDPSRLAQPDQRPVLSYIWDAAIAPALASLAGQARDAESRDRIDAFVRVEERIWRETTQRLPHEIANQEYAVSRTEAQLRDQLTKLGDLRRQQRALQLALPEAVRQAAREQHEALRRLVPATYRSIDVRDSQLVAVTRPIVLEDDDGEVEVGTFEVAITLDTLHVRITNTTRVTNGIHHPHVRGPEDICWGNVKAGITRLLAEREWAGALVVVSRFLNSYTEADSYQRLAEWDPDRAEEEGDDEETADDDTTECTLCLDRVPDEDVTWVRDEPVCPDCLQRDCFRCTRCQGQFTSRDQARESLQCRTCWEASSRQAVAQEGAS